MLVSLLAVALPSADAKMPCHIEAARYVLRADSSITARYHPVPRTQDWPAGLAMEIHFAKSQRTYWWLPTQAGTAGIHGFRWTALKGTPQAAIGYRHNLGDLLYFAFDKDYAVRSEDARRGQAAPAHFLLHNMREAFWYRTPNDQREAVTPSLFDLVDCHSGLGAQNERSDLVFPPVP